MSISGIVMVGCGNGSVGPLCSLVKTDWNCAFVGLSFLMIVLKLVVEYQYMILSERANTKPKLFLFAMSIMHDQEVKVLIAYSN